MKSTKKHSSFSMQETDEAEEENEDLSDRQKQIREGGAVVTKNRKHTIQCLTVIGQIEGHYVAPSQNKTTKYEHVIPQIVSVEEDPNIDGLLMILNTVGGDVEAGLAIAELVAGMRKPTVSLVLGGGHSIGVYDPATQNKKKVYKMMHDKRIRYYAPADYTERSELDLLVKAIIDKTAANEILEDRHFRNIAEAKEHEK